MKYRIISFTHSSKLEDAVETQLKRGWKLQGGVAVESSLDVVTYHQVMIKED